MDRFIFMNKIDLAEMDEQRIESLCEKIAGYVH